MCSASAVWSSQVSTHSSRQLVIAAEVFWLSKWTHSSIVLGSRILIKGTTWRNLTKPYTKIRNGKWKGCWVVQPFPINQSGLPWAILLESCHDMNSWHPAHMSDLTPKAAACFKVTGTCPDMKRWEKLNGNNTSSTWKNPCLVHWSSSSSSSSWFVYLVIVIIICLLLLFLVSSLSSSIVTMRSQCSLWIL